ncbi:MAG: class I tRNA ligase family protein, partial [Firmicutes bacterium]|nr:class I tRNA ligase family protein [Bacillota bacterium]
IDDINYNMDHFDFALAAQKINNLIWDEFCDWYIELTKARLHGEDEEDKQTARFCLLEALRTMLRLLHPFMPFITEEIWGFLPGEGFLMSDSWPKSTGEAYAEDVAILELSKDIIKAVRNIRAETGAAPSKKLHAVIIADAEHLKAAEAGAEYIRNLANLEALQIQPAGTAAPEEAKSAALPGVEVYVPLDELLDYKAEFERLIKERDRLENEVKRTEGKLANEQFVSKAPEKVINNEREKLANYRDMLAKTLARIPEVEAKLK